MKLKGAGEALEFVSKGTAVNCHIQLIDKEKKMSRITNEQIETIVDGQTDVTYEGNGVFIVKEQIKYAIKQALELNEGKEITLPKGQVMKLTNEI